METFCRRTMQLPLFELETFPLLHRQHRFVFTCEFLKEVPYVFTNSQIAR